MQFLTKLFKKPDSGSGTSDRLARELLRENLNTVAVDMFDVADPLLKMNPEQRTMYLKHMADLAKDDDLMNLIKMLINQQVVKTMYQGSQNPDPKFDFAGSMKIDGMACIKDAIEQRAAMHRKETPVVEEFNKYSVFPELK